ncbi:hypothetical protein [Devosia faecipullorum]|uniref:hypothetical protein n=1 Tax=Devosia faecipullorum TaxID=2755039 RepID=UPI00187BA8F4|nr:hypothetical protein [Devosia faecipullorum]MBE7732448.1 hypothetical protein [Devosia faecipullorum]
MSDGEPRNEEVAEALQHLLSWPAIARSGQLAKFLDYIVQRKLAGEAQSIKAYSIAVDVFGRSTDFDPQSDPIVRVQARRLRALIGQFYREEGADDAVRITLPTGRYVPEFVRLSGAIAEGNEVGQGEGALSSIPEPVGLPAAWLLLAVFTIGFAILAFAFSAWERQETRGVPVGALIDPPSLLVTEFQSLTGDVGDIGMAAALAVELVNDLGKFETVSVRYGGGVGAAPTAQGVDYVLSGIVRRIAGGLQYSAILTEATSASVVWNRSIALTGAEARRVDMVNHVAERLSLVLGNSRGPLHTRARLLLNGYVAFTGGENLYLCRMLFDLYRESGAAGAAERAQNCFAALGEDESNNGQALAAKASLMAEISSADMPAEERFAEAERLLSLAIERAPVSGFVWEQRARLLQSMGLHDLAEAAYGTALQLNPADSDAIAARAMHLALLGRQDSAARLAERIIAESPAPPPWYYGVPVLEALRQSEYQKAVAYAGIYADADRELGPVLAVMAGQALGDTDIVNRYLPRVLDFADFRSHGVLTQLRQSISDEKLLREIRVALLSAGVPAAALNGPY